MPLVDSWARLAPSFPDWHLLICGLPHEYSLADIAASVRRHPQLDARTTLADPAGLAKPYSLAELYLLPTLSENFGLTIGESLASGTPALTTTAAPWAGLNERDAGACVRLDTFEARWSRAHEARGRLPAPERVPAAGSGSWPIFPGSTKAREMLDFYDSLPSRMKIQIVMGFALAGSRLARRRGGEALAWAGRRTGPAARGHDVFVPPSAACRRPACKAGCGMFGCTGFRLEQSPLAERGQVGRLVAGAWHGGSSRPTC